LVRARVRRENAGAKRNIHLTSKKRVIRRREGVGKGGGKAFWTDLAGGEKDAQEKMAGTTDQAKEKYELGNANELSKTGEETLKQEISLEKKIKKAQRNPKSDEGGNSKAIGF